MSKTLSVNVAQYSILNFAAMCAEKLNKLEDAEKYKRWALRLKESINRYLYNENLDYYYAYIDYQMVSMIYQYFDMIYLARLLPLLLNVADKEMGKKIISNYPIPKNMDPPLLGLLRKIFLYIIIKEYGLLLQLIGLRHQK